MPTYKILAYDKDQDRYDIIVEIPCSMIQDAMVPRMVAKSIWNLVKSERLKTEANQPYDWVELHLNDDRIEVFPNEKGE